MIHCNWMFCRDSMDTMSKKLFESRSTSAAGRLPSNRRPQTAFSTSSAATSTQPAVPPSASSGRKSVPSRRQLLDPVIEERAWTEKLQNEKRRNAVWYDDASFNKKLRYHGEHSASDFCSNRKFLCDFLLVININLHPLLHRIQVMADYWSKWRKRQRMPHFNG